MRQWRHLVAGALVIGLSLGTAAVPATALAASATTTRAPGDATAVLHVGTRQPVGHETAGSVTGRTSGVTTEQERNAIGRAFVNAVKKYGASAFTAMVRAATSGRSAFKRWFDTMPGWVKVVSGSIGTDALYDVIKSTLGL